MFVDSLAGARSNVYDSWPNKSRNNLVGLWSRHGHPSYCDGWVLGVTELEAYLSVTELANSHIRKHRQPKVDGIDEKSNSSSASRQ